MPGGTFIMPREYKIFSEPATGKITITEHSQYNQINAEKVTVQANVTARLYGFVKDINLKEGSLIFMHGNITGNVVNEGGEIQIFHNGK